MEQFDIKGDVRASSVHNTTTVRSAKAFISAPVLWLSALSLVASASVITTQASHALPSKPKRAVPVPAPAPPISLNWLIAGNSITPTSWLGTDAASVFKDLVIKTNAIERMRVLGTGNVGIGTSTPASNLDVVGGNNAFTIHGLNSINSNGAAGVMGESTTASSIGIGVYGNCFSTQGRGVFGASRSTTGVGIGVYGFTEGDSGTGVLGQANSSVGVNYGVFGRTFSQQGYAGYFAGRGYFSDKVGIGTLNPTSMLDVQGTGLYAITATNAINSNGAAAIFGLATSAGSVTIGVEGDCQSTQGRGVFGAARNTTGVSIGVYGYTASGDPAGYGVFSGGNLGASGFKTFRIDHPLDPENKFLVHYSSESPEPMNFYSGVTVTDNQGSAWVKLPDYFSAINKDFRYSLTVVDDTDSDTFVQAKVAREIRDNSFKIRTNAPRVKVSWRVEAVRNDRWVQKYGAPVEIAKQGTDIGKYQRPELYGQPANKGIDFDPKRSMVTGENRVSHP